MRRVPWVMAAVLGWTFFNPLAAVAGSVYDITIEKDSFAFKPHDLSIHVGDTVRWTNKDGQLHMVVTAKPDSNGKELEIYTRLDPQASPVFEHQFATPASYFYYCAIHFQMWGVIAVNP